MDEKQFIATCTNGGYCTKVIAEKYVKTHIKEQYDDSDLMEAHRLIGWPGNHTKGIRSIKGGRTTSYSNIRGNSSKSQDWV